MSPTERRAVWRLGASQCLYWGLLYYGFAVLQLPWQRASGGSQAQVAGAYSLGLLVMALAAPAVGRRIDRGRAAAVFHAGTGFALAGLVLGLAAQHLPLLYPAWGLLGLAMACLLYEPAFGLVIRHFRQSEDRLRALATVTVLGGLASTLCLPLLAYALACLGWRGTLMAMAVLVALASLMMSRAVLPTLARTGVPALTGTGPAQAQVQSTGARAGADFAAVLATFVTGTVAAMAMTTLLVPLLVARGMSPESAALALSSLGVMQLPGRVWLMRGRHRPSMRTLVVWPVALQAIGLGLVSFSPGAVASAIGVAVFGLGAGILTLSRPWLLQALYGRDSVGYWNGRLARWQGLARAATPLTAAGVAGMLGQAETLALAALALALSLSLAYRLAGIADAGG